MKKLIIPFLLSLSLIGCNSNNVSTPESNPEEEPEEKETLTYEVDFTTTSFADISNTSSSFATTIKNILDSKNEYVSSVDYEGSVQLITTKFHDESSIKSLIVGSAKYDGSITFNFLTNIKNMKIKAQPYYKTFYDYQSGGVIASCDLYSQISINEEDWLVGSYDFETSSSSIVEKVFEINDNSVTISGNACERTFIREIEFTIEVDK